MQPGIGLGIAGLGLGVATFVADSLGVELPNIVLIGLGVGATLLVLFGVALEIASHRADTSDALQDDSEGTRDLAGRDVYAAGGDIRTRHRQSEQSSELDEARALEKRRSIRDEIRHIQRRFKQLDANEKEWGTIWPVKDLAPYQPLPSEKWNLFGPSLHLPQKEHDTVQEAYELANDFNHLMQRGPRHFGDDEPDLGSLRKVFDRAAAVIESGNVATTAHGSNDNPYARASMLQTDHRRKELRIAMRTISEDELEGLVRPRLADLLARRTNSMQLATAQWTRHHELIKEAGTDRAYRSGAAAYRAIVDLDERLGLTGRTKKLKPEEIEEVSSALAKVNDAIDTIRADTP